MGPPEYLCFLQGVDIEYFMASLDEAKIMAKSDQGQIYSTWICVVLVGIDEIFLILWITVLEKYPKYFIGYSSMDGLEAGLGTFNLSWERRYSRNGLGFLFIAGFDKLS